MDTPIHLNLWRCKNDVIFNNDVIVNNDVIFNDDVIYIILNATSFSSYR